MSRPFRLALIPLDERHWCGDAPVKLARIAGCEVLLPPRHMLGDMKVPGDFPQLGEWLRSVAGQVDGIVVAVECLAYGGLIPSRTSHLPLDEARKYVSVLRRIRAEHPALPIYAFTIVMRIPAYNSDQQEPTYWAEYGAAIHKYSQLVDRVERHNKEEDRRALAELERSIPAEHLADWRWRRERNHQLNLEMLDYVADGTIDLLLITQDDSAEYGVSAAEQRALRRRIAELSVEDRALIYPGADEVAMVLVARHICRLFGRRPRFYPRYASIRGPLIVPRYEDRPLGESVKGQVDAVGGLLVETPEEADIVLFLNSPGDAQAEAWAQYDVNPVDTAARNLLDFVTAINYYADQGRLAAVADVAYSNGADGKLVSMLLRYVGLKRLAAYAAWNTAGNTLGTAVAQASVYHAVGKDVPDDVKKAAAKAQLEFLLHRLIEDWAYQAVLRWKLIRRVEEMGLNPHKLGDRYLEVQEIVAEALREFAYGHFGQLRPDDLSWYGEPVGLRPAGIRLENIWQPWKRMFNVAFDVTVTTSES